MDRNEIKVEFVGDIPCSNFELYTCWICHDEEATTRVSYKGFQRFVCSPNCVEQVKDYIEDMESSDNN